MTNKEYAKLIKDSILKDKYDGGYLDITEFVNIPNLKYVRIYFLEYDYKKDLYNRFGMNSYCKKENLEEFIEDICFSLDLAKDLSLGKIQLDSEKVVFKFNNETELSFSSSEWGYFNFPTK